MVSEQTKVAAITFSPTSLSDSGKLGWESEAFGSYVINNLRLAVSFQSHLSTACVRPTVSSH